MTRATGTRTRRFDPHAEDGFTLPELLISIAILAIIVAPLAMSFILGLRVVGKVDEKFQDSRSGLISAADWATDVANAQTITLNSSGGACGSVGGSDTVLVTFAWSDANSATNRSATQNNKASYVYDSSAKKLYRRWCAAGQSSSQSVPAVSLSGAPTVSCTNADGTANATCTTNAASPPVTRVVKLAVQAAPNAPTPDNPSPAAYTFTLTGTRRPL
jgi:prepilin-type N-terminal cleavage/methylation domain-containing protein